MVTHTLSIPDYSFYLCAGASETRVLFAHPGERWRFNGEGEGWVHVTDEPRKAKRLGIDAEDAEAQARQDWSNDE